MGKYLITGVSGAGKSTVIGELQKRGFTAYDTEELPDLAPMLDRRTGKFVDKSQANGDFKRFVIVLQEDKLKELLDSDETVFLSATGHNQSDFYPLFNNIFALIIDESTQEHRLATRTNNDTGNNPIDREYLVSGNQRVQSKLLDIGAIAIDATKPLTKVIDSILSHIDES